MPLVSQMTVQGDFSVLLKAGCDIRISERAKCLVIICLWLYGVRLKHTGVLSHVRNLNFFTTWATTNFNSIKANLIPMQFLGPWPNGMKYIGSRFAFSSGENLNVKINGWELNRHKWYWIKKALMSSYLSPILIWSCKRYSIQNDGMNRIFIESTNEL